MRLPNIPGFSLPKLESYISRLPLFTRAMLVAMVVFQVVGLQHSFDVRAWGALIPDEIGIQTRRSFLPDWLLFSRGG